MASKKPRAYMVVHNGVGPFVAGQTVHEFATGEDAHDNMWPDGTDLQRLIRHGAIVPLSAAQARDMEEDQDPTMGGTFDPLRTENAPTLPRPAEEGVPETTTPVGGDHSGEPEALDSERAIKREARRR